MNPEQTQELSPEEAKAALGNATFLQEQLLGGMGGNQEGEMASQSQERGQIDIQALVEALAPQIAEMVKSTVSEEMGGFRKELKDIINGEETEQENSQSDTE